MRFRRGKIEGFRRAGRIFVFLPESAGAGGEHTEQGDLQTPPAPAELDRLTADNARLHEQHDRLLTLLEREQVLRQQLQTQLTNSISKTTIEPPPPDLSDLERRLRETENNFELLKRAVSQLVLVVEGRG